MATKVERKKAYCIDCGKKLSSKFAKRCVPCYKKFRLTSTKIPNYFSIKDGKKKCTSCGQLLSVLYFPRTSKKKGCKLHPNCMICLKEKQRKNRLNNPEKYKKILRRHRLKKYGLSIEAFEELFKSQKGKCAICGVSEVTISESIYEKLNVDHDHNTGRVRGLLCPNCNLGIGNLKHNINILNNAIEYLRKE